MKNDKHFMQVARNGDDHTDNKLSDITYALDLSAIVAMTDKAGKVIYVNDLFEKISKYTKEELIGNTHRLINSGYHPKEFFEDMWKTISQGEVWHDEVCNRAKDGAIYWVDTTIVPFLDKDGKPYQYISIRSDITLQKNLEEELRKSTEIYGLISRNSRDLICVLDEKMKYVYASPSHAEILGFDLERLSDIDLCSIVITEDQDRVRNRLKAMGELEKVDNPLQFRVKDANENIVYMETTINLVQEPGKYMGKIVLVMRDITARLESERMINDLLYNDQLTEVLNRASLRKKIDEEIKWAKKHNLNLGFVYLNIDRLRYVNDSFGHEAGDYVLSVVAKRLKEVLRYDDKVGRIAGDEFAFTLRDINDGNHALRITEEVQNYLEEPIELAGQQYILSTSFGIAMYPEHAGSGSELAMKAEKALQETKANGGNGCKMYKHGTAQKTLERILLENELRKSVKLGHFTLEYQPQVNLATGRLVGVEALVRWKHPELGMISPDKFIPVAEETKIIIALGEWVLRVAFKQAKVWQDYGYSFTISINISMIQLEDLDFLTLVENLLNEYNVKPELIDFELTESAFSNREGIIEKLINIRELGISISIDDFGTGYSSFSYIKELPADTLKIDMSFIRDIHVNEESLAIVKAILSIAKTIDLNVVAEGIEKKEQADILLALGCQEGQGYLFSKPMTPEKCEEIFRKSF